MKKFLLLIALIFLSNVTFAKDPPVCPLFTEADYLKEAKTRSYQAEFANDLRQKSKAAQEGIFYANKCLQNNPNDVGCLYYRAVNRGLYIETRTSKIKKDLHRMVDDFMRVIQLNDRYDDGGAYLAMGYVYLKAPKLPVLGKDIRKDLPLAESYAIRALTVAPNIPENLQLAGEISYKKKDYEKALDFFKRALKANRSIKNPDVRDDIMKSDLKKWVKKTRRKLKKRT